MTSVVKKRFLHWHILLVLTCVQEGTNAERGDVVLLEHWRQETVGEKKEYDMQ